MSCWHQRLEDNNQMFIAVQLRYAEEHLSMLNMPNDEADGLM